MNVVSELKKLKALKQISPDPVWAERTRVELLEFCRENTVDTRKDIRHFSFFPRFALITIPAFALLILSFAFTQSATDIPNDPGIKNDHFPIERSPIAANPNLPLATSVDSPLPTANPLPILATNVPVKYGAQPIRRTQKTRRPVASTRLAMSVQSLPQAHWVFSENSSGEQAHWVFSERGVNANGS